MEELKRQVREADNIIRKAFSHYYKAQTLQTDGQYADSKDSLSIILIKIVVGIFVAVILLEINVPSIALAIVKGQWYTILVSLVLDAVLIFLWTRIRAKRAKNNEILRGIAKDAIAEKNAGHDVIAKNMDKLKIIPSEYWYPMATEYICRMVETERATTINEALNMYDEQLHRWRMEQGVSDALLKQESQLQILRSLDFRDTFR